MIGPVAKSWQTTLVEAFLLGVMSWAFLMCALAMLCAILRRTR